MAPRTKEDARESAAVAAQRRDDYLAALKNEQAAYTTAGKTERAKHVGDQIKAVESGKIGFEQAVDETAGEVR